jgi:hypothetical protein
MSESPEDWAEQLAREGAWVLQIPNRVVGQVRRVHEAIGADGRTYPTIHFEEGHNFHATPKNFVRLTEREVAAYQDMQNNVRMVVGLLARRAADGGMRQSTFQVLLGAVLSAQVAAFDRRQAAAVEVVDG